MPPTCRAPESPCPPSPRCGFPSVIPGRPRASSNCSGGNCIAVRENPYRYSSSPVQSVVACASPVLRGRDICGLWHHLLRHMFRRSLLLRWSNCLDHSGLLDTARPLPFESTHPHLSLSVLKTRSIPSFNSSKLTPGHSATNPFMQPTTPAVRLFSHISDNSTTVRKVTSINYFFFSRIQGLVGSPCNNCLAESSLFQLYLFIQFP